MMDRVLMAANDAKVELVYLATSDDENDDDANDADDVEEVANDVVVAVVVVVAAVVVAVAVEVAEVELATQLKRVRIEMLESLGLNEIGGSNVVAAVADDGADKFLVMIEEEDGDGDDKHQY